MIVVPVHEEDGWIANSPGEAAKARLEAHSPPKGKSPEVLQAASERAQALHQLHIESVKMRAKRDLERVREAEISSPTSQVPRPRRQSRAVDRVCTVTRGNR